MALAASYPGTCDIPTAPESTGSATSGEKLTGLPNVVGKYLNPSAEFQHPLPKSKVGLLKPALLTFQTWSARSPSAISGLLLGSEVKGAMQCHRLVCETSIDVMWRDDKIAKICQRDGLVAAGIVISANETSQTVIDLRDKWFQKLHQRTKRKDIVCVVVPRPRCLHRCFVLPGYTCAFVTIQWVQRRHSKFEPVLQVHRSEPEQIGAYEFDGALSVEAVSPRWTHQTQQNMANICWLFHLLKSNRELLYDGVCKAVVKGLSMPGKADRDKVPFEVIPIAGDGRCGWRCLVLIRCIYFCYLLFSMSKLVKTSQRPSR